MMEALFSSEASGDFSYYMALYARRQKTSSSITHTDDVGSVFLRNICCFSDNTALFARRQETFKSSGIKHPDDGGSVFLRRIG
jgi:hypothetical protein